MKTITTISAIAAIGLSSVGFASPALASHFEPENTLITATGGITVTAGAVSLPCTANLGVAVDVLGNARVNSATFSGLSCAALTASNLPWPMGALTTNKMNFKHVTVSAVTLGVCGPGKVKATITTKGGRITISGANLPGLVPCSLSGTLTTSPHLNIRTN